MTAGPGCNHSGPVSCPGPDGTAQSVRVRLEIGYDGTEFSGWAAQPGRRTVQGELTDALHRVLRGEPPVLTVAGRTDAGVHARGQVAHLDVPAAAWAALPGRSSVLPEVALLRRLAGVLPGDLVVGRARVVPVEFDARFAALWRRYRYRIADRRDLVDPLRRRETVVVRSPLDAARMQHSSAQLLGLRDFAAFCKARDGRSSVRTLLRYDWERDRDGTLCAHVVADAFCHSMVRFLIGALVPVGEGRRSSDWPAQVLAAGRRDPAVVVMPAHGLSLEEVGYPADADLAARTAQTRAVRTLPVTAVPPVVLTHPEREG